MQSLAHDLNFDKREADAERDGVLHLGDDVKKVADARLGQVDDVLGDET